MANWRTSGGSITNGSSGLTVSETPRIWITDESITDLGDAATEGTLAWHFSTLNAITTTTDRKAVIELGPGEFDASTLINCYDSVTLKGAGIDKTVINCTAVGGGIHFEAVNSQWVAATAYTVGHYVYPSDTYATANSGWAPAVRFRCTTAGTSHASSEPDWINNATVGDSPSTIVDGTVTWTAEVVPIFHIDGLTIDMGSSMTGDGLKIYNAHQSSIGRIKLTGGNSSSPNEALHIDATNELQWDQVKCEVDGNGILFDIGNVTLHPFNYGDAYLDFTAVKLSTDGTYGIKIAGSDTTSDTLNNMVFGHAELVGSGAVADAFIPLWLHSAKRNTFLDLDIEGSTLGIMESSISAITCTHNWFPNYKFIPASAQQSEAYPWARGLPWQAAAGTPYDSVTVRSGYLTMGHWANLTNGSATFMICDIDGSYSRALHASTAINADTPSAGITTLDLAATVPSVMRDTAGYNAYPCIHLTSNFSSLTSFSGSTNESYYQGYHLMNTSILQFAKTAGNNSKACSIEQIAADELSMRDQVNTTGGINFDLSAGSPQIGPDDTSEILDHAIMSIDGGGYTVAGAPTASSYTNRIIYVSNGAAGSPVLAISNGTNWIRLDGSNTAIAAA